MRRSSKEDAVDLELAESGWLVGSSQEFLTGVLARVNGVIAVELACEQALIWNHKFVPAPDQRALLVADGVLAGCVDDDFHSVQVHDHCLVGARVLLLLRVWGLLVEGCLSESCKNSCVGQLNNDENVGHISAVFDHCLLEVGTGWAIEQLRAFCWDLLEEVDLTDHKLSLFRVEDVRLAEVHLAHQAALENGTLDYWTLSWSVVAQTDGRFHLLNPVDWTCEDGGNDFWLDLDWGSFLGLVLEGWWGLPFDFGASVVDFSLWFDWFLSFDGLLRSLVLLDGSLQLVHFLLQTKVLSVTLHVWDTDCAFLKFFRAFECLYLGIECFFRLNCSLELFLHELQFALGLSYLFLSFLSVLLFFLKLFGQRFYLEFMLAGELLFGLGYLLGFVLLFFEECLVELVHLRLEIELQLLQGFHLRLQLDFLLKFIVFEDAGFVFLLSELCSKGL